MLTRLLRLEQQADFARQINGDGQRRWTTKADLDALFDRFEAEREPVTEAMCRFFRDPPPEWSSWVRDWLATWPPKGSVQERGIAR
jgi:hypothetical protein